MFPNLTIFHFLIIIIFIEVELIYNVVLVSGVQQTDSVIHPYISIFFKFFSLIGYYKILGIIPTIFQLNDFSTLQWCKSDMHSVETVLQILNFDLLQASDMQYSTL